MIVHIYSKQKGPTYSSQSELIIISLAGIRTAYLLLTKLTRYQLSCPAWTESLFSLFFCIPFLVLRQTQYHVNLKHFSGLIFELTKERDDLNVLSQNVQTLKFQTVYQNLYIFCFFVFCQKFLKFLKSIFVFRQNYGEVLLFFFPKCWSS